MGRKEWQRHDSRDSALELVRSGRQLTPDEIAIVKNNYSGIGGLCPTDWSSGAFFTPPVVISFIHNLVGLHEAPGKVIEMGCGSGGFFEGLEPTLCTGIEASRDSFMVAQACYPEVTLLNTRVEEVFPCDRPSEFDEQYDYCIGNPPYGLKMDWAGEILSGRHRKIPSECVFMELAYRSVRPGGKIALVVPDSLLSNNTSLFVREWLMDRCFVRAVISLPTETFYHAGTGVKTSVLFLERFPEGMTKESTGNYKVFMALCENIGWNSRGKVTDKCNLMEILVHYRAMVLSGDIEGDEVFSQYQDNVQQEYVPSYHQIEQEEPIYEEEPSKQYAQMALF